MNTTDSTAFQDAYLATWTEADVQTRHHAIEQVWAPTGRLVVSSLETAIEGTDAISAHITRVHDDLIAGKGLTFAYDQQIPSGDSTLLRWSMITPSGDIAGRGVDIVFRDDKGRIETAYMYMGVN